MSLTPLSTSHLQVNRLMLAARRAVTIVTVGLMLQVNLTGAEPAQPVIELRVPEGSRAGTGIGAVENPALTAFAIVAGNEPGGFAIDAETGLLRVQDGSALDFERQPRHELRVQAERRGADDAARRRFAADLLQSGVNQEAVATLLRETVEFTVVVEVLDVAEPPVLGVQGITLVRDDAFEGAPASTVISAVDGDAGDSLWYEILAGDPDGLLQLDPQAGRLSTAPEAAWPAGRIRLPVTVRVTDSTGLSDAATLTVDLIRLAPPAILLATEPGQPTYIEPLVTPESASVPAEQEDPAPAAVATDEPVLESGPATPATEQAETQRTPAASDSDLGSRFVPILLVLAAGVLTTLFLRRRQRVKSQLARETLQHGADMLARPLPSWLSASRPAPRQPLVVAVPGNAGPTDPEAGLIPVDEAVIEPDVVEDFTEVVEEVPRTMDDTVILADLRGAPTARRDVDAETVPADESAEPIDVPAASSAWSPHDLFAGVEPAFARPAVDEPEPVHDDADAQWSAAAADRAEPGEYAHVGLPAASEDRPALPEESGEAGETYALQDDVYELEGTGDDAPRYEDEGSYVGGWTQDDELPYDNSEVAAVQEASDALEESGSPLGVDPRVAELRAQLSNLFGVSLSAARPPEPPMELDEPPSIAEHNERVSPDEPVVDEPTNAGLATGDANAERFNFDAEAPSLSADHRSEAAAPLSPEADSDPVRSWLEYLKNRNAPAPTASVDVKPALETPPAVTAPATQFPAPPVQVSATKAVPLVRQNKSAVRLEISHLRDVANRHTRGVLAVKASEQKARLWWFLSGASMVVLCFVSMALLKSQAPVVRWLGWAFLCGAAVNLAVCVNSFQRLKTRADADEEGESADAIARPERTANAESDLLTPEMEARLESILQTEEQTPVEAHA